MLSRTSSICRERSELQIPLVRRKDRRRGGIVSDVVDPEAIDFKLPPSLAGLSRALPCGRNSVATPAKSLRLHHRKLLP